MRLLDRNDGSLRWGSHPGAVASPALTRTAFVASAAWPDRRCERDEGSWSEWRVEGLVSRGHELRATLCFHRERLISITLAAAVPGDERGWDGWSQGSELARKEVHDALLGRGMDGRSEFVWGSVNSLYDAIAASSYIRIEYATEPWKRWLVVAGAVLIVLLCLWLVLTATQLVVGVCLLALFVLVARQARSRGPH